MTADNPHTLLERLLTRTPWTRAEAASFMREVMAGRVANEVLAAALGALRIRGETADEVAGLAEATRAAALPVHCDREVFDIVGTGGDGAGTFNISTTAAIVAAAAGVPVAKHGNRSVSSRSGAADVLEAMGVAIDLTPDAVATSIARHGFAFLFAPRFHPGFAHAAPVRKALGVRTVFNLLGPLVNPARPAGAVIGVWSPAFGRLVAETLRLAGVRRAVVVHGDGLDEWTTTGRNTVWDLADESITEHTVAPEDLGLARTSREALRGGSPADNAALVTRVLAGEERAKADVVCLNAGSLIHVAGRATSHAEGIALAHTAIDNGGASALLAALQSAPR